MKNLVMLFALAVAAMAGSTVYSADTKWPERSVEVVVPFNPGGDSDLNARIFLKYMEKELGQSMVVVNMSGAAETIGVNNVLQARPNGYRALFHQSSGFIARIMGFMDEDMTGAFEIAALPVIDKTNGFFVNDNSPFKTIKDAVEQARANPDTVSYATESGAFTHLQILALEDAAGVKFNVADVGTASEKITALMGGRVDIISTQYGLLKSYIDSGEFRCIGLLSDDRIPGVDVPTFKELGYPVSFDKFFFIAFPKGTDRAIVEKFNAASKKVFDNPEYKAECAKSMVTPTYYTPEDAVRYIRAEDANYRKYEKLLQGE